MAFLEFRNENLKRNDKTEQLAKRGCTDVCPIPSLSHGRKNAKDLDVNLQLIHFWEGLAEKLGGRPHMTNDHHLSTNGCV